VGTSLTVHSFEERSETISAMGTKLQNVLELCNKTIGPHTLRC